MTEYFAVITTLSSGLNIGDVVQLLSSKITTIKDKVPYSLGIVVDVGPDIGLPYHDIISLKFQERRPFPLEDIAKYSCRGDELKSFKDTLLNIMENNNIDSHISNLSTKLHSSLQKIN